MHPLDPETRLMPRTLIRIAALAATITACGGNGDSATDDVPCDGSAGGNLSLTERADMVYTVSFREDSGGTDAATIESVIVARGAAGWKQAERNRDPAPPPTGADSTALTTSVTLGGHRVGYDHRSHVAWIHNERVALDSFNVILVDRIDSVGGAPTVVQRLHIPPTVRLDEGACGARANPTSMLWVDSIRARLMRAPEVRAFAAP